MKKNLIWCLLIVTIMGCGKIVSALERGPVLANNILGGAGAGAVVGLSAGLLAYGLGHNYNPDLLANGAVYGVISGAVLGTGVGIYEISTERLDTGFTMAGYTIGGTGIGALLGGVIAFLPYMRDKNPEDFTIGLGLGGVVGAACGLGFSMLDIQTRSGGKKEVLLSGNIGIYPEAGVLAKYIPEAKRESVWCCRLAKVEF